MQASGTDALLPPCNCLTEKQMAEVDAAAKAETARKDAWMRELLTRLADGPPTPPSPRCNRKSTREPGGRETMDERLQRLAAERVQAAARGKAVREQRARYLKGGGRPDASDFKAWMASDSASGAAAVSARVSLRS